MIFKRVEEIWIKPNKQISYYCHLSKNLYNEANYIIKQEYSKSGKWVRYYELNSKLKTSENYKLLPSQTAQQTLRLLDRSWKSFFNSIKIWKKNKNQFKSRPKPPKYKNKNGEYILVFTNQQCKIRNNKLIFPKMLNFELKTRFDDKTNLREVRIIPKGIGYSIEIVYDKEIEPANLDKERIIGIDLGIRNLVTIANNIGEKPIIVKGGVCKSINQFCNKEISRIQKIYMNQGIKTGKKLKKIINKRNRKIKDYLHKVSRFIINYCIKNNIGTIIIGYNQDWKQNLNIGKKNNQNFYQIPFNTLINQIKYKSEETGIDIILQEESHTSKCSFLDNEPIEYHNEYMGKRIKRGLFRSKNGIIINADVQSALNIIRKAVPKAFAKVEADGIEGVELHPIRFII